MDSITNYYVIFLAAGFVTWFSYRLQLAISEIIIDKHLAKMQNKHLNEYFNSQTDGIILYAKPERATHLSKEKYRIEECETLSTGTLKQEKLCKIEVYLVNQILTEILLLELDNSLT